MVCGARGKAGALDAPGGDALGGGCLVQPHLPRRTLSRGCPRRSSLGAISGAPTDGMAQIAYLPRMIQAALWVFVGGGLGSVARWAFGQISRGLWASPVASVLGTMAANFVACLLLGYVLAKQPQERQMWFWAVGFCGGFSTFSTFSQEVLTWLRSGDYGWALGYVGMSLLGGLAGLVLGARWA